MNHIPKRRRAEGYEGEPSLTAKQQRKAGGNLGDIDSNGNQITWENFDKTPEEREIQRQMRKDD